LLARFPLGFLRLEVGENGLPADGPLADGNERAVPGRQVEVDARAETNEPEPLAYP
jgi:hypothetical protein